MFNRQDYDCDARIWANGGTMRRTIVLLLATIFSSPAFGQDSWLCIAEYMAWVSEKDGQAVTAESGRTDKKYFVDKKGVRVFGEEDIIYASCTWTDNGRPEFCEDSPKYVGHFRLNRNDNVFTITYLWMTNSGELQDVVKKGKCERL